MHMRRALFILLALAAPAFPDLATAEQLTAQGQSPANVSTTVAPSPARQMQTKQDEIEEEVLEEEEKEEKELEEEEENSALQLVVIVSLLALALVVGRIMHRRHILSIPESGVTILVGLFTGFAVHFLFPGQSVREQSFYFDPEFFSLFSCRRSSSSPDSLLTRRSSSATSARSSLLRSSAPSSRRPSCGP